jgi:BlaI family transcriptional regulator, penicillinase repressor
MKPLTKAEEQIMHALWKLDKAFLREIVDAMPNPKPHQNTVATLLKILVEKEFVDIEVLGRQHRYFPLLSKQEYSGKTIKQLAKNYFEGSFSNVVSYLVKENNISVEELESLLAQIKKQQKPGK